MSVSRRAAMRSVCWLGAAGAVTNALAGDSDAPQCDDTPAKLETAWVDLEKDEPDAARALLVLADQPKATIALLGQKLKPLSLDEARLKELLVKLGNPAEDDWKPAFEELEYFDPRLATDLENLMRTVIDTPTRQRMVEVLSGRAPGTLAADKIIELRPIRNGGYNFRSIPGGSWWAEHDVAQINASRYGNYKRKWTRAVRAIALLEHIGTPDAVAILKQMATGHPLAQPTRAAMEALSRIVNKAG